MLFKMLNIIRKNLKEKIAIDGIAPSKEEYLKKLKEM